jgi:peroxidase
MYRFGHSMIQDLVKMINTVTGRHSFYRLKDQFFNTTIYVAQMEGILLGMINQKALKFDTNVVEDVTDHLFGNLGRASDLIARNIQRGRDHGLPGYNEFREICGLKRVCSWDDPPSNIPAALWERLYLLYDSPSDIDLFTAGLSEDQIKGAHVGETFACIIASQLEALKFGDR